MNIPSTLTQRLSDQRRTQRDSARVERDSALQERDDARLERDDFKAQTTNLENNKVAQEQFVAMLSHDLRNPINAIQMAAEILREDHTDGLTREMIDLIDRNADQAGDLISQLLDAHLIRSGAMLPLEQVRCDLFPIFRKCHQSLAPADQNKILFNASGKTEVWGFWDPLALERAFKNLISNAIKFTEINKPVRIQISQGEDVTDVSFQNFGEVISLENQLRIFDSQVRVHQKDGVKQKKGWGLGLTLVRGIAEAHRGKVEVTSNKHEGTTFTLKIPNESKSSTP